MDPTRRTGPPPMAPNDGDSPRMADILPFIGTRYNTQLLGAANLAKVLAPPYDAITPDLQDILHTRHEHNVVRMELGRDEPDDNAFSNRYTRAANTLKTWRSDGILIEDEKPGFYLYEQEFAAADGTAVKRRGFFALVKLEDYDSGTIRAHEHTSDGPKADRLKLIRQAKANVSAICVTHDDPDGRAAELLAQRMDTDKPWEETADEQGTVHRLWVVQKKDFVQAMHELLKDRPLVIVDGHHRFETALEFRDEQRDETGKADGKQPFDYAMMFISPRGAGGPAVLPTHRALTREFMKEVNFAEAYEELGDHFDIAPAKLDLSDPASAGLAVVAKLVELGATRMTMAMVVADGRAFYLTLKDDSDPADLIDDEDLPDSVKGLDVSILHHYVINQVMVGNPEFELDEDDCLYTPDAGTALALLTAKKASLAFILNPSSMEQIDRVVEAGGRMACRSTLLHPAVATGLVFRNMETETKKSAKR